MAFENTKLSYFHSFSKMPAQSSTTLGNAINKSGHTVTASEVWAQDIPYYGKMGSLDDVKSKIQPYARKNDMCYITAGADKGKTFQYDGNGNWTDITATLVDGALIKNANDDVVLLYHKGQTLTNLTADNNANTDSANNAARLWAKRDVEGVTIPNSGTRLIEQFVAPTDKALNGLASVAYAPVIANGSLISGTNYYDYCFSGTILWASARTTSTVIDCFEYVGQKVSTVVDTVATNAAEIKSVKDQVDTISESLGLGATPGQDTLGSRVSKTESALRTMLGLGTDAEVVASQSIAKSIQDAIDALGDVAVKSDIKISDIKVKVGSGTATSLTPDSNKSVTIEIPDAPEAVVTAEGTVTTDGFTKTAAVTSLAKAAINAAITGTDGAIADAIDTAISGATLADGQKIATTTDTSKLVTVEDVTTYVSENAKVTLTQGTGITVTPNGEASTSFTVAVDDTVATKKSVDDLDTRLDTAEGTLKTLTETGGVIESIQSDIDAIETSLTTGAIHTEIEGVRQTANAAKATADTAVQTVSKSGSSTLLTVTQTGTSVTVGLSDTVATKSDITTEINKLSAADGAITALSGRVSDIETSLAAGGETAEAIAAAKKAGTDAQTAADAKVADVTVDGTSIVTGADGSKSVALTTTKGVEITPNATSTSTALATEASVAKAIASITSVGVSYEVLADGQTHTSVTAPVNGRIYLEKDTTNAEAGVYIEWMYTEKGWEQIGSTKTDHSSYASKITVNGSPKTVANSEVDLGAFASSVTAGNGVASGSVSTTGALSLVLTTASTETAGITKLDSTIAGSTSETTAATPKAVKEYADTKVGDVQWFGENDILSTKAEVKDGKLVITEQVVNNPNIGASENDYRAWNTNVVKVVSNEAFNADGEKIATIETDKLKNGTGMFYNVNISEFASDMPLLENGRSMFAGSDLTQFVGDLPSLTLASTMFDRADIVEFIGDLSSLTWGY